MQKKLLEFSTLSAQQNEGYNLQVIKLKTRIEEIDKEIAALLDKVISANATVMEYINNRVSDLDTEKKKLYAEIAQLDERDIDRVGEITDYMEHWEELTVSDKITVVDCLIERIDASKDSLNIKWKI
jgi:predicted nuclease with TOPRIM domain